jgi:hypothetical protein
VPAARGPLRIEAGSYEPYYWNINDSQTGAPIDLTQPGYAVHGVVADRSNGTGSVLLDLPDSSDAWRRTTDGRVYFQPHSVDSAAWTFRRGYVQIELAHPSGETVRIHKDRFYVDPELVV